MNTCTHRVFVDISMQISALLCFVRVPTKPLDQSTKHSMFNPLSTSELAKTASEQKSDAPSSL